MLRAAFALIGHVMCRAPHGGAVAHWTERLGAVKQLPTMAGMCYFLASAGKRGHHG